MVIQMISLIALPAVFSAMAPLVIISTNNPKSFNELQTLDRPAYHDVGLALRDLHG